MLERIPLEAFRVFDAACRFMNFSRAGRELHITQAAVSRRIQGLEAQLGQKLFLRNGRNLTLTPQGERLFQRVHSTLEYLEESLEPFREGGREIVSIAASGSMSHFWLGRRLADFTGQEMPVSIRLLTTDSPAELAAEANDLVILYSTGEHPRWRLDLLLSEILVPVASPAYLSRIGIAAGDMTAQDIAGLDLIDYERFNAHWISFRQWFTRISRPPPHQPRPRLSFSTYALAVAAALRGQGVTLGSACLLDQELQSGALVALGTERLETGYGYYLGAPRHRALSPAAEGLHRHLMSAAGKTERQT